MLIEAQRIAQRTNYDIEMLEEIGFCSGIENYSRVLARRPAGSTPFTLLDFLPDDFVLFCGRVTRFSAAGKRYVCRRQGKKADTG